jgi:hypothetical protein
LVVSSEKPPQILKRRTPPDIPKFTLGKISYSVIIMGIVSTWRDLSIPVYDRVIPQGFTGISLPAITLTLLIILEALVECVLRKESFIFFADKLTVWVQGFYGEEIYAQGFGKVLQQRQFMLIMFHRDKTKID